MKSDFSWSYLTHFGMNSWIDVPLAGSPADLDEYFQVRRTADYVRFEENEWRLLSEALAKSGCNQIVIDLAEVVEYPSHPELAVSGSWSPDRLRRELDRLRGLGFEVVPKLNFSAGHDSWLKEYHRMVSTREYYRVCADVIRDTLEIFGPETRLFHLGYDEETAHSQRHNLSVNVRQGELWWHDFLWFVREVEQAGVRAWIWGDYSWKHEEFLRRVPRSVLISNWHYEPTFDLSKDDANTRRVQMYARLDQAGFDQVPTGSNWTYDGNLQDTIRFCDAHCDPKRLKGYLMAPWTRCIRAHREQSLAAVALLAEAIKMRKGA